MSEIDDALWRLAATQHGLLSRAQALAQGLTPSAIQHRRRRGQWLTPQPGVYFINGAPFTWSTRVLAACLSSGGVASHRSAAVLHQVRDFGPGTPEVTVPRGRRLDRTDLIVHESGDLALMAPVLIHGIPTSSPPRLAADLGGVVPFHRYESAMDDLIARSLLTWDQALHSLFAHSERGRTGVGALRLLLEQRYGDDVAESVLERAFYRRFADLPFPAPIAQHVIEDGGGFVARVDYAYPERRIAIELDSLRYHLTGEAFEADRRKRNRLRLAGWLVLEFTWKMVIESPATVYRQIRHAYDHQPVISQ